MTFRFQEKEHCLFEKKVMVKKSLLEINKNTLQGCRGGGWWLGWGGGGDIEPEFSL